MRIRTLSIATFLLLGAGVVGVALLTASLPRRDGQAEVAGLGDAVTVELDRHAVARVRASSLTDAFAAQGFLHAQERFFQMDLARRSAAGELAEMFGTRAIDADRRARVYQFRRRARAWLARLDLTERAYLESYAAGVNAGLNDLGVAPPEYLLLGSEPRPWTEADSLLVVYSVYTMLSNNDAYERDQAVLRATLPAPLYAFLTPSTSRFDRPLTSRDAADPTGGYVPLPLPSASVVDLRGRLETPGGPAIVVPPLTGAASNQWAIGASRSGSGLAILGNDPHLRLRIPNTFYRVELYWPGAVARGVSIPGVPGVLIGASDAIAWGATVSNVDQSDFVVIEVDPNDPTRYGTPDGPEYFTETTESIAVADVPDPVPLTVTSTRWGPLIGADWLGRPLALRATWLDQEGINLTFLSLIESRSTREALDVLKRWSGPSMNWLVVDTTGQLGWIVNGPIPRRTGFDGSVPESWADGHRNWSGRIAPPQRLGASTDALFTANNRTLDYASSLPLGRIWMRPLRAHRIAALLADRPRLDESASLAMQLDTRVEGFEFFRQLLLEVVPANETDRTLQLARQRVAGWNGRADTDQVGFRILQLYYSALLERVLGPLLAPARAADPSFVYRWPLADEPLRRILEERPPHLLSAGSRDWAEFLRAVLADALADVDTDPARPDADAPWGAVNRLAVAHPLAGLPLIGGLLRLDEVPLPGSMAALRVAAPNYGAVMRMSVAPADPAAGILQMPAGQSGHFLSGNFDDLQADWVDGTPTPFLAGPPEQRFTLRPAAAN